MFGRSCVDQQESAGSQRFKVMTAERVASHWQNVCINFNLLLYWSVNMWSFWAIPSLLANCQKRRDEEEKYLTWGFQSFFLNSRSAPIHTETISQICVLWFIFCSCRNLKLHRKINKLICFIHISGQRTLHMMMKMAFMNVFLDYG